MVRAGIGLSLCRESIALHQRQSFGLVVSDKLSVPACLSIATLERRKDNPIISALFNQLQSTWWIILDRKYWVWSDGEIELNYQPSHAWSTYVVIVAKFFFLSFVLKGSVCHFRPIQSLHYHLNAVLVLLSFLHATFSLSNPCWDTSVWTVRCDTSALNWKVLWRLPRPLNF